MDIIRKIDNYIKEQSKKYIEQSKEDYNFYDEHISYVYKEAIMLANKYNADIEIVSLGALLHDVALINQVGERKDHHINGAIIAKKILKELNYDEDKIERVCNCIKHHRSTKDAKNIEEICVSDADVLAHFDNVIMIFNYFNKLGYNSVPSLRKNLKEYFEKDYNDLSDNTKHLIKEKYENIIKVLF